MPRGTQSVVQTLLHVLSNLVVLPRIFLGAADDVTVSGSRVGMPLSVAVQAETGNAARSSLSRIWARLKIAELVDEQVKEGQSFYEYGEEILQTALEYELLSDYTSFVAVDTSRVTEGSYGTTVHQAVPVPDGVRYDTTVE